MMATPAAFLQVFAGVVLPSVPPALWCYFVGDYNGLLTVSRGWRC